MRIKPEDASGKLYTLAGKRVWVAGHRGMVGAALVRRLGREQCEILTVERTNVDLTRQDQVVPWMSEARPQAELDEVGAIAHGLERRAHGGAVDRERDMVRDVARVDGGAERDVDHELALFSSRDRSVVRTYANGGVSNASFHGSPGVTAASPSPKERTSTA